MDRNLQLASRGFPTTARLFCSSLSIAMDRSNIYVTYSHDSKLNFPPRFPSDFPNRKPILLNSDRQVPKKFS